MTGAFSHYFFRFAWLPFLLLASLDKAQSHAGLRLAGIGNLESACNNNYAHAVATDWGVVGDGTTDDTEAMRKLLESSCSTIMKDAYQDNTNVSSSDCPCHKHIVIPEGTIVATLPLNLTSHTSLQVDGTLLAIATTNHWPIIAPNPIYGTSEDRKVNQYQSFLYAQDAIIIRVTGSGLIDGNGPFWWDLFTNQSQQLKAGRPNLFQTNNCTGIELDGVTMKDAGFWTVHPMLSRDIYIHHMKIRAPMYAPNVDGIDPDSCQNVLVEYNDVACGDDHIAIKAGVCGVGKQYPNECMAAEYQARRGHDHYLTRNVTIRHNIFRTGMGIAVGSESSGSIRDVFIYNNTIGLCEAGHDDVYKSCGWGPGLHIKTTITRSGSIENIIFDNNTVYNNSMFIFVETNYQVNKQNIPSNYPLTVVKNVVFQNNRAMGRATGVMFHCDALDPCHGIRVMNNTIARAVETGQNPWSCQFIDSYNVAGNVPGGLEDCMAQSMNHSLVVEQQAPATARMMANTKREYMETI